MPPAVPGGSVDRMTNPFTDRPAHPQPSPHTTARGVLCLTAILACLPYLALKTAWIAGSDVGIPAGSFLLDPDSAALMRTVNGLTVLMDSAVVVLALMLSRPWGMRVPGWLPLLPVWVATGLLAPIVLGWPAQVAARVFAGPLPRDAERHDFLQPWVFDVVYGGFLVQALALGALFVLYARDRWGHRWSGRGSEGEPGASGALRAAAVVALCAGLFPLCMQASWAAGSTAGLGAVTTADYGRDFLISQGAQAFLTAAALTGLLILFRTPLRHRPSQAALALTWVGSGAMAGWGGWLLFVSLTAGDSLDAPAGPALLVYAAQMTVGMLIAAVGARLLTARAATGEHPAPLPGAAA